MSQNLIKLEIILDLKKNVSHWAIVMFVWGRFSYNFIWSITYPTQISAVSQPSTTASNGVLSRSKNQPLCYLSGTGPRFAVSWGNLLVVSSICNIFMKPLVLAVMEYFTCERGYIREARKTCGDMQVPSRPSLAAFCKWAFLSDLSRLKNVRGHCSRLNWLTKFCPDRNLY